jgi:hypothetical protein
VCAIGASADAVVGRSAGAATDLAEHGVSARDGAAPPA